MPARRRNLYKKKTKTNKYRRTIWFTILAITILLTIYLITPSSNWNGSEKLSLAINRSDGSVLISTFDPVLGEITNLTIPADTQVSVARQLGLRRLRNVWHLGKDEKLNGQLLTETISRNLKFPVYNWADYPGEGLSRQNILEILKAVYSNYETSLSYKDRIKIALFSIKVKNIDRINLELKDFSYIRMTNLVDGEEGYVVSGAVPQRLVAVFSDESISEKQLKVNIVDVAGSRSTAEALGEVVEILGLKVVSIESLSHDSFDCIIIGTEVGAIEKLSKILSCEYSVEEVEGNIDVEIKIGDDFVQRY